MICAHLKACTRRHPANYSSGRHHEACCGCDGLMQTQHCCRRCACVAMHHQRKLQVCPAVLGIDTMHVRRCTPSQSALLASQGGNTCTKGHHKGQLCIRSVHRQRQASAPLRQRISAGATERSADGAEDSGPPGEGFCRPSHPHACMMKCRVGEPADSKRMQPAAVPQSVLQLRRVHGGPDPRLQRQRRGLDTAAAEGAAAGPAVVA